MSKIEDQVCAKLQHRAAIGLFKYGVTLERTDLNVMDWANHLQEELMDACNYLEKFMCQEEPTGDDFNTVSTQMLHKITNAEFTEEQSSLLVSNLQALLDYLANRSRESSESPEQLELPTE